MTPTDIEKLPTPLTDAGEWPTPEHAQEIVFEGRGCVVMSPEEYAALHEHARQLERELAEAKNVQIHQVNGPHGKPVAAPCQISGCQYSTVVQSASGHDRPCASTDNAQSTVSATQPFQFRVAPWMQECFGPTISADVVERNHRFLEESLELVQTTGCTASEAHQLVDYVFSREKGVSHQEVGGVMVTLAALCLALGLNMHKAGDDELARIWTKIDKIRAKQAAKPKHSPLPAFVSATQERKT